MRSEVLKEGGFPGRKGGRPYKRFAPQFKCPKCNKAYKTKLGVTYHLEGHK